MGGQNQSHKKLPSDPAAPVSTHERIAIKNAYSSLLTVLQKFDIPIVKKTYGNGIIHVSCKTIEQLDNIALIMNGLIGLNLIEEIGIESLASSFKVVLKPTDVASSKKLDHAFQTCSFEYPHLVLDVEYPAESSFKVKRNAVKRAYSSFCQLLKEFNIPCVKTTFGLGIVRVCCRSVVQLDNITPIMKVLVEAHLIEEVGMPLEYSYKMKSLVLFLKPTDMEASMHLDQVFEICSFEYHHLVTDVKHPTTAKKEKIEEPISGNSAVEIPMDNSWGILISGVLIVSILILTYELCRI